MSPVSDTPVGIRRALATDVDALNRIQSLASGQTSTSRLERHLAEPGVYTYMAEEQVPFGFVTVGPAPDLQQEALGEVLEWYLLPDYQQRGYGRKLLVHGLTVLKRRLCESALIWLPAESSRATDVVVKHGFEAYPAERIINVDESSRREQAFIKGLDDYF